MKIDVKHVAKLANLKIKDSEIEKFEKQLSEVLAHIDKLKKTETKNVLETSQVTGLESITREDKADSARILSQEEALSNTKNTENGFFKVKGVIQSE